MSPMPVTGVFWAKAGAVSVEAASKSSNTHCIPPLIWSLSQWVSPHHSSDPAVQRGPEQFTIAEHVT